jgi:ribonuclease G
MYVSSAPHETKVALVEDDQLAELFFERENEYTLGGSIYKGRVTRVLPGMQSAFVDIGLERDAFLYVSDFLEVPEGEEDDFGEIAINRPETFVSNRPSPEPRIEVKAEPVVPPGEAMAADAEEDMGTAGEESSENVSPARAEGAREEDQQNDSREFRRRRRPRRGRGFPDSKFARPAGREEPEASEAPPSDSAAPADAHQARARIVLPGESIAKYQPRPEASSAGGGSAEPLPGPPSNPTAAGANVEPMTGEPLPPPAPARVVLPGESIAKYQPRPEASSAAGGSGEPLPGPASDLTAAGATMEPMASDPLPPPAPARVVLPGESIAKYQSRPETGVTAAAGADLPPTPPPGVAAPDAATEREGLSEEAPVAAPETGAANGRRGSRASYGERDYHAPYLRSGRFAVLPGENISKYQTRTEEVSLEQAKPAAEGEEPPIPRAAAFVIESEPWSDTFEKASQAAPAASRLPVEEIPDHQDIIAWTERPTPVSAGREEGAAAEAAESREEAEITEESAAPFAQASRMEAEADALTAARRTSDQEVYGRGTLEHEEIEGDETELHPAIDEERDSDFIELEEQSFELHGAGFSARTGEELPRGLAARESADAETQPWRAAGDGAEPANGEELSEALEESEAGGEHALLSGGYGAGESDDFDEDLAFEEEELTGEESAEPAEEAQAEPGGGAQVEVRSSGAAAGYPRPARPFDRRRGHRGGPHKIVPRRREQLRQNVPITDLLKEGQEILVQIAKEPIGKKGARITSHIALPGRFLVYMPTVNHIGVSRKISNDDERQRLKGIMISEREGGHGGFIVRTAAAGVGENELRADIRFLKNLWAQIKQRADSNKAPALIYHDLNLVERTLRDLVTSDFSQVWVDNELEYERVLNFANRFQPGLVRRVKLYTKDTPLFEQFGIQEEMNKALKPKVWLKSGGYIVINQTEALVAIDVNTGKYVGKTARLEDTIVKTNVDAIKEIVRQVRLRDLGGIIVVDFIDMDERRNRQKVMQALDEALRYDRAPSKVLAFNDFGLVAITRKRVKQSLERTLSAPCPYCGGGGYVKSVITVCNEIFAELRKMRRHLEDSETVSLRVNTEVAKALKLSGGRRLQEFEELTGRTVLVQADPLLHQEQFDIN